MGYSTTDVGTARLSSSFSFWAAPQQAAAVGVQAEGSSVGLGLSRAPHGQNQSSGSRPGLCWHARVLAFSLELLLGRVKPHTQTHCSAARCCLRALLVPSVPPQGFLSASLLAEPRRHQRSPCRSSFLHPARLHLLPSWCHFPCQSLLCSKGGCLVLMKN